METILTWNQVTEQILGLVFLFLILPILFGFIDQRSTTHALDLAMQETTTTPTTTKENGNNNNSISQTKIDPDTIDNPNKKTL